MSARRPKLPPLVRYQVNMFTPRTEWNDWDSFASRAAALDALFTAHPDLYQRLTSAKGPNDG